MSLKMLSLFFRAKFIFLIFTFAYHECLSYKPVFIIHGILSKNASMTILEKRIKELHPTTDVFVSRSYDNLGSLEPMWRQTEKIGEELMNFSSIHPEGIHLIGYSQGGLLARAILEKNPNHNVKTFISLSSPQAGQYGTKFLRLIFPNLVKETAYKVFYTAAGQLTSVGNYWNDPHQQTLFHEYNIFLPVLNNEIPSKRDPSYTQGLLNLETMILIGGPDDEVITPWQSSLFGFFDSNETVQNLVDRNIYKEDFCGLKTLDDKGKLKLFAVDGVRHLSWRKNFTERFVILKNWLNMDGGERVLRAMSDCIGTRQRPRVRQPGNCPSVELIPIYVGDPIIS